jgi:hypothetical protein
MCSALDYTPLLKNFKMKRSDLDPILGASDYEPGFLDALAWAILCTLIGACVK